MQAGKAKGLYVALPTMATANAMFTRLSSSYRRLFQGTHQPSIVLTHGRRNLFAGFTRLPDELAKYDGNAHDEDDPSEIEASAFCADWIARSNKQAFLAQVGAGTIDQAILAVLPARHQSLRLWGLADKVLVIDEAHAYDAYMNTEIECLLKFHAALGGSAIVLSATLPHEKRAALANAFLEGAKDGEKANWRPSQNAYPLVTSVAVERLEEKALALRDSLAREVAVQRLSTLDEAHIRALEAAKQGAAVAVIRNTVDEAIGSYEALSAHFQDVMLFHARFTMGDRQRIETEVLSAVRRRESRKSQYHPCSNAGGRTIPRPRFRSCHQRSRACRSSHSTCREAVAPRPGQTRRRPDLARSVAGSSDSAGYLWPAPLLPRTNFVYKDAALLSRSAK